MVEVSDLEGPLATVLMGSLKLLHLFLGSTPDLALLCKSCCYSYNH